MALHTCHAMARGGIYDQLAGGFARYSVDAGWVVPHFEKMLYDNAQLARVYAHAWRLTGDPLCARVALETADFLVRDLGTPAGLASSLDADTDGVEGLTYVWTPADLRDVLGEADGVRAAGLLGVTDEGTFDHGASTLRLPDDPDDPAWWRRCPRAPARGPLAASAAGPRRQGGGRVERPGDRRARRGRDAARPPGSGRGGASDRRLRARRACRGRPVAAGVTRRPGRPRHRLSSTITPTSPKACSPSRRPPENLAGSPHAGRTHRPRPSIHFRSSDGEWFDSPDDGERLVQRPRSGGDNAEPGGLSAIAGALLTSSALTGSTSATANWPSMHWPRWPRSPPHTAPVRRLGARGRRGGGVRPAGGRHRRRRPEGRGPRRAWPAGRLPRAGALAGEPDAPGVPLLADRPLIGGAASPRTCAASSSATCPPRHPTCCGTGGAPAHGSGNRPEPPASAWARVTAGAPTIRNGVALRTVSHLR